MQLLFRLLEISDYPAAHELWLGTDGVGLSAADEPEAIAAFLRRNPGLSFAAVAGEQLIGTILCGHDGRRGLIHHLAVAKTHRRRGIAKALLQRGLQAFRSDGIDKCHLLVFKANKDGMAFWQKVGAEERITLSIFSLATPVSEI